MSFRILFYVLSVFIFRAGPRNFFLKRTTLFGVPLTCKYKNFNNERSLCASTFSLFSFSLTHLKSTMPLIIKDKEFLSVAYICNHTQSTFVNEGRRKAGKLINGIVLKFSNSIKILANLLWEQVRLLGACGEHAKKNEYLNQRFRTHPLWNDTFFLNNGLIIAIFFISTRPFLNQPSFDLC